MNMLFITVAAALVLITLPMTLELVAVTVAALLPRRRRSTPYGAGFRLAVIVAAHNEEGHITRTVESLRNSSADVRIVVVAHNSTDRTAELARQAGAEVVVYTDPEACGKGFALRRGFAEVFSPAPARPQIEATSEYCGPADGVLIIDADSTVSPNLIPEVRQALAAGADAVQCRYEMESPAAGSKQALSALAFRAFNYVRPRGRERLGISAGILGNGFAIRKSVYERIPYGALSLVEDLEYHLHLVLHGIRVQFLERAGVWSDLPTSGPGADSQRARWEGGRIAVAREWLVPLVRAAAHGRWRVIEPVLDLASPPMSVAAILLLAALIMPVTWLRAYAAVSLVVMLSHVLVAVAAGPHPARELWLLTKVPFYLLWKLCLLPRTLRGSRSGAKWVRTERNAGFPELNPRRQTIASPTPPTLEDAS